MPQLIVLPRHLRCCNCSYCVRARACVCVSICVCVCVQLAVIQSEQKQAFLDKCIAEMTAEREEGLRIRQAAVRGASRIALPTRARVCVHVCAYVCVHACVWGGGGGGALFGGVPRPCAFFFLGSV